ncbi:MAG: M20 family metallopeptidase [Chloroflexi bacterium]|nr:M20 family metallopeptidase [Chloroflexota bacterium]
MTTPNLKSQALAQVERQRPDLIELSLRIHSHPELGFKEEKAARWLTDYLEAQGFAVERGFCGLPTAFRATYGSGRPALAFLAEYDALAKLGHACGHNIIATAAVGAGVAVKEALARLRGQVQVIGSPAEEVYGGKAIMAQRGAFSDLDAAMMIHPGVRNTPQARALACIGLEVEFFGKAAHAAARPHEGINALEALILAYGNINSLRQHIRERARIHGIITDGGEAPNIVPAHAAGSFLVRAVDAAYLEELRPRALACFQAAAQATGARLAYRWAEVQYEAFLTNETMADLFRQNLETLGRSVRPLNSEAGLGSTDMGNVSQLVPAIHPTIAIAPTEVASHSLEFAQAAASEAGHLGLLDGAKALALTAIDLLGNPRTLAKARAEFLRAKEAPQG